MFEDLDGHKLNYKRPGEETLLDQYAEMEPNTGII